MAKKQKYYELDAKKHGVGGLITIRPTRRKQDKRALATEFYAVVFFPKINGIGKAEIDFWDLHDTLSQSPEAARVRFMDKIRQGEKWEDYANAGHRIRRVKITDLGDA